MKLRYTSFVILLTCIIKAAIFGSHFELIKNSGQQVGGQGSSSGTFLHKAHFQCDREHKCTHIIQLDGSDEYVMVYGEDALKKMTHVATIWKKIAINVVHGNIALGKPSALSSLWRNHTIAALAVDGNKATISAQCAQTKSEEKAWLRVDLQASAVVQSVSVLSFEDKSRVMKGFDIRAGNVFKDGGIGNPPCQLNVNIPANNSIVHVQCPSGMMARYVTVNTPGIDFIEICEIEIFGYFI